MDRKREQKLIRNAQEGNRDAFAEIYRAYVDKIYRYVLYRVDSDVIAEDLTADIFLKVLEGLPTYEDRSVPLLVWLYRIAHARVVDHYRRQRRPVENIDDLEVADTLNLDGRLQQDYTIAQIRLALATLTDAQRQVIILRFIEGLNLESSARAMNKTVDAIKAMQYRALQALALALSQQGFTRDAVD